MANFMDSSNIRKFAENGEEEVKVAEATTVEATEAAKSEDAASSIGSLASVVREVKAEAEGTSEAAVEEVKEEKPVEKASFSSTMNSSLDACPFTKVNIEDNGRSFAKQWQPNMDTPNYIGESTMLLEYLRRLETKHKVTMPIKACGIDPILFENIVYNDNNPNIFPVGDEDGAYYELIKVDGDLYMSCISECLDEDHLNSVIAAATAAVKENGSYTYRMVGYRKLALESNESTARLLNTLKLNTYEMSVLVDYMGQFEDIDISFDIVDDHQCLIFRR